MTYRLLDYLNFKGTLTVYAATGRADLNAEPVKIADEKIRAFLNLNDDEDIPMQNMDLSPELDDTMSALKKYLDIVEEIAAPFEKLAKIQETNPRAILDNMFPR